jgi:predicted lipoprotein with Yx(FWY)xxD motif
MRIRWLAVAGLAAAALVLVAACGSSSSPSSAGAASASPAAAGASSAAAAGSVLKSTMMSGTAVLTNAKGFTLYWFAPDTSTTSKCNGTCAHYWPPVKGPATAGAGVTGKLGVITRSDGSMQATYNGHPLYTYVGDTKPGEAKGNGLNLSGGVWHEVTVSGAAVSGGSSPSSGSTGGGYGY